VVAGPVDLEGPSKFSHWTFDNPLQLGDDTGGLDYDGIVRGDVVPAPFAAVGSGAVQLDGADDYIEIPQGAFPYANMGTDGDGFTVATWVCSSPAGLPNRQRYFSKYFPVGGGGGFGVGQDSDTQLIATTYGIADYLGATAPLQDEWHHVAYVYRGNPVSGVDFYLDGILTGSLNAGNGVNGGTGSYAIGGIGAPAGEWFDGLLDDLRIYAVELPVADIATLAAMGTPGPKGGTTSVAITSVRLVSATRLRVEFEGAANTLHQVRSSADLAASPFAGAVTVVADGLTTGDLGGGRGAGFVEIDVTVPGALFFQIQQP
jgi:hypothetical protein